MAEFSPVTGSNALGCHMVVEKGTHIHAILSNPAMVYSAVVIVMTGIVHRQM